MIDENQTVRKPLPCEQKWDDMLPHERGRICLGCGKLVTDFRNKKWKDIDKAHRASPLPVCGLYSDEQLKNWGREIQVIEKLNFSKWLKYSAVFLSFTNLLPSPLKAQTTPLDNQVKVQDNSLKKKQNKAKIHRRIISGTVVKLVKDNQKMPLPNVIVLINHRSVKLQTLTDSLGTFKIDISSKTRLLPDSIIVLFSHSDYPLKSVKVNKYETDTITVVMSEIEVRGHIDPLIVGGAAYRVMTITDEIQSPSNPSNKKRSWWKRLWKK